MWCEPQNVQNVAFFTLKKIKLHFISTFSEALPLCFEVEDGGLAVRVRVVGASGPLDEVVERVLVGVLLASHEHHVLAEVGQPCKRVISLI